MQGNLKTFRLALTLILSLFVGTVSAQTVNGNVVDETGEAVIGATVMEKGTKNATVTDFDGNFTINMGDSKVLVISYIGMQTQEINVAGKSSVNVVLKEDATTLQDVVVVGYGTMKKTDLTGSVSSVNTEQLNAKGAPSVLGNLQGSNPGVNITQSSGRGGSYNIEIRGKSSINSSTTPLYVVDGVMCDCRHGDNEGRYNREARPEADHQLRRILWLVEESPHARLHGRSGVLSVPFLQVPELCRQPGNNRDCHVFTSCLSDRRLYPRAVSAS